MRATYLMEDHREGDRVVEQVDGDLWAATYLDGLVDANSRILEVGSGPLHLLNAATDRLHARTAVGVDLSEHRLAHADTNPGRPVTAVAADGNALPFRNGSFDLTYTRFVLEYTADPQQVVDELVRVTRPSGVVLLQDLDGQLVTHYPPNPELEEYLATMLVALKGRLDPFVGRRLFSLATRAGLVDAKVCIEPYHLIAGPVGSREEAQWKLKLQIAQPALDAVLGDGASTAADMFMRYLADPNTITFSLLFTVTGRVPHLKT